MRQFPRATKLTISRTARIGRNTHIGVPDEKTLLALPAGQKTFPNRPVSIGKKVCIGCNVIIYEGAQISDHVIIEDGVCVGPDAIIMTGSRLCCTAIVCDNVSIGKNSVIGGFICDEAVVEDGCRIFGALVHEQSQPHRDWWDVHEKPPHIRKHSTIGWNAVIIGNVTVGPFAYIAAGAVINKDVPARTIVSRDGRIIPASKWKGKRLQRLVQWWGC